MPVSTNVSELMELAGEEIKRADHLIYVSLKYTRTVDVLKSIIERLINAFDCGFSVLLQHAKNGKKISVVPELQRLKMDALRDVYKDDAVLLNFFNLYLLLKRINKANFDSSQEYRRHVTMTAHLDGGDVIEITIDIIGDYFKQAKEFLHYVDKIVKGKED